MKRFSYSFILAGLLVVWGCHTRKPFVSGFDEPADPDTLQTEPWKMVPGRVHAAFGSIDIRYSRSLPPDTGLSRVWYGTAWKGEHLNTQVVLWSTEDAGDFTIAADPLYNRRGDTIDPSLISISPTGYVLTDASFSGCGPRNNDTMPSRLVPDILFQNRRFNIPAHSSRPVWLDITIPHTAKAGLYQGSLSIRTPEDSLRLPFTVRVQNMELPGPNDWHYHLDLWQNPFAIARYHQVTLWSQKHWALIRKYLALLADAGQKCITTSIIRQPWSAQTYDPFQSMITWIHNSSGRWDYDYSIFDHYVEEAMRCGITEQINCYTMVPWGNHFRYMDEDSSKFVTVTLKPGTPEYEAYWRPFLYDFREHLKERGWLDKTCIALDERGEKDTKNLIRFMRKTAPEFKLALAGHYFKEITPDIYDFSYNYHFLNEHVPSIARQRKANGQKTTYYVACGIPKPNNFTFSPPAESAYEGWLAAAMNLDGFLRWAYNSWPADPLHDSRYIKWPAGDDYMIYPGPLSSIRFERLREGIQDYEKIRILQALLKKEENKGLALPDSLDLVGYLKTLDPGIINDKPAAVIVNRGKKIIEELTDYILNR